MIEEKGNILILCLGLFISFLQKTSRSSKILFQRRRPLPQDHDVLTAALKAGIHPVSSEAGFFFNRSIFLMYQEMRGIQTYSLCLETGEGERREEDLLSTYLYMKAVV